MRHLAHRDNIADFFTREPRGRQFPEHLAQVSDALLGEQEKLTGDGENRARWPATALLRHGPGDGEGAGRARSTP